MGQYLFVYGTLQNKTIRDEILSHSVISKPSSLKGFRMGIIILDEIEYPILHEDPESRVIIKGEYFAVNENDLIKLDEYESEAYQRKIVMLENGVFAWVYYNNL